MESVYFRKLPGMGEIVVEERVGAPPLPSEGEGWMQFVDGRRKLVAELDLSEAQLEEKIESYEQEVAVEVAVVSWERINALSIVQLRPSQDSVDFKLSKGKSVETLAREILCGKWLESSAVAAVKMPDGTWTSLDNRRMAAAYLAVADSVAQVIEREKAFTLKDGKTVRDTFYDSILRVGPQFAERRAIAESFAARSTVQITSWDLPHNTSIDTKIACSISSLLKTFEMRNKWDEVPKLPSTLTEGSYGHAVFQRMHNGDKHRMLTDIEAKGTIPYGFNQAPFVRRPEKK